MTDTSPTIITDKKKMSWGRRLAYAAIFIIFVFVIMLVILRIFLTTSSGAKFVENQINSRSFGPVEAVEIEGLSGDLLGEFSLSTLLVKDKTGIWLETGEVSIKWKPLSLLKKHIDIERVDVARVDALRRPELNETDTGPLTLPKITLTSLNAAPINLDESLMGRALNLAVVGGFNSATSGVLDGRLNVKQVNDAAESVSLNVSRLPSGVVTGEFEMSGKADGTIATLIKAPAGKSVAGTGQLRGTIETGNGDINVIFNGGQILTAKSNWTPSALSLQGRADIATWPALARAAEMAGGEIAISSNLQRDLKTGFASQPFLLDVSSDNFAITAQGELSETGAIPDRAEIDLKISDISKIVELPDEYNVGAIEVSGLFTRAPDIAFEGSASAASIKSPYATIQKLSGPVSILQRANSSIDLDLNLKGQNVKPMDFEGWIDKTAVLIFQGNYNHSAQALNARTLSLTSGEQQVSLRGELKSDLSEANVTGSANIIFPEGFQTNTPLSSSILQSDFKLLKTPASDFALSSQGEIVFAQTQDGPLADILGSNLAYNLSMSPIEGGAKLEGLRVETPAVILEMAGVIAESIDVDGEAQTLQALALNGVSLETGTSASFDIAGLRSDPNLRLDTKTQSLEVKSQILKDARLRADLSDLLSAPHGVVQLEAKTEYGDLIGSANVSMASGKNAKDIDVTLGPIKLNGDMALDETNLATGALDLTLASDGKRTAMAKLNLMPQGGVQGISFTLDSKNVAYQNFEFDRLYAKADGTFNALTAQIDTQGKYTLSGDQYGFELSSPVTLQTGGDNAVKVSAVPEAMWDELQITSRSPVTFTRLAEGMTLAAPLSVRGNAVDIEYRLKGQNETLLAKIADAPIRLLPLPAALAETRGRVSADINITSDGSSASGLSKVTLTDWRGFEVEQGNGLTVDFETELGQGAQSNWRLQGRSEDGFSLDGVGQFSVSSGGSIAATRLNMDAAIAGQIDASGPAAAILGLLTPSEDDVGGTLDVKVSLSGTASNPEVKGQAQGRDLKFEVPEIGTQIRNGLFTADFTNDRMQLSQLSLNDGSDGSLTAEGSFELGEFGRPIGKGTVKVSNFTALDRRDVTARLDGNLVYESKAKTSSLTGDLKLDKANIRQFVAGSASVIEIEVEEINRPAELDPIVISPKGNPIELNVNVLAPRNILVNSRGLDVELSMDATVKGTVAEPLFFGTASVVRGGYKIAGKTLAFETGSIEFSGALETAKLNLEAETETTDLTAVVEIGGTVESPTITLSSTPERPQDEVLSALLFGRSVTELSALESVQLAGALAQFSGVGGGFDLLGGLRESLGITQLNIATGDDGTAQISGGRYLARNVYLQLFSGSTLDQTGAIIDWEVRPNIALRSKLLADNDQSLSLKVKRDF